MTAGLSDFSTAPHEEEDAFLAAESRPPAAEPMVIHPWQVQSWRIAIALAVVASVGCATFAWQGVPASQKMVGSHQAVIELEEGDPAADAAPTDCSGAKEDCHETKCCREDSLKCFEKNEFWAVCNATCVPGVHPGEDNKGWTCAVLTSAAPVGPAKPTGALCAGSDGEDCSKSKCCLDPDERCFEKNKWYATCRTDCIAQVHDGDSDKKPWSCKILTPDMKDEPEPKNDEPKELPPYKPPPDTSDISTPPVLCDAGQAPMMPQFSGFAGPEPVMVKVLTYNLFWWNLFGVRKGNAKSAGLLIQSTNSPLHWDLMGFQECEDGARVLDDASLQEQMEMFQFEPLTRSSSICMAYNRDTFNKIAQGGEFVAEDSQVQYYGKRAVQWLRLEHKQSNKIVFFMNHHGALPVNSGGKCGGQVTANHILRVISTNAKPGDAIIFTGDFNADPGSPTLNVLSQRLTDFVQGHEGMGGIDNIFSNLPPGSLVRNMDIGDGGSDHHARLAVFKLGQVAPVAYAV